MAARDQFVGHHALMAACFYCSQPLDLGAASEHVVPAAVGGSLLTHRVCSTCNQRAGSEVDGPWQSHPSILELRNLYKLPDRHGRPPRSAEWPGELVDDGRPAIVRLKGESIDIRMLPVQRQRDGIDIVEGDSIMVQKWAERAARRDPDLRFVELPAQQIHEPLRATVQWELNVHIWPRLAAKVALGVASLCADDEWIDTPIAAKLRHVLWHGDQSTVDAEMLPPGRSWSIAPFELDASNRLGLRPPEHLVAIEEFDGEQGISFVFAGTLLYTVLLGRRSSLPLVSWLLDPIGGTCRMAPGTLLSAELQTRSD